MGMQVCLCWIFQSRAWQRCHPVQIVGVDEGTRACACEDMVEMIDKPCSQIVSSKACRDVIPDCG
jgi:hypothetical protein